MATVNYSFTKLNGTDIAGHTSINTCIDSIDLQLKDKTFVAGMIIIYNSTTSPVVSGWSTLGKTVTGLPTLTGDYWWIQKGA
jgi:hypothetical protein